MEPSYYAVFATGLKMDSGGAAYTRQGLIIKIKFPDIVNFM